MRLRATDVFLQLPSVSRFIDNLREEITRGRNWLALVPATIDTNLIWSALRTSLIGREFRIKEVDLSSVLSSVNAPPAAILGTALGITWPKPSTPRTLQNLLRCRGFPDVTYLGRLETIPVREQGIWVQFLTQWASTIQSSWTPDRPPPIVGSVVPATIITEIPLGDVRFAIHWWWGRPSALEVRLHCRVQSNSGGPADLWREFILPSLSADDLLLAEYLWDSTSADNSQLQARLRDYATARGWTDQLLRDLGADDLLDDLQPELPESPPARLRSLWAIGAIHSTLDFGVELHSAAMAVLGRDDEIEHRLWRGQAALLLPMVDSARLHLCDLLTRGFGPDWPLRWVQPTAPEEVTALRISPFACQLGHLERLLRHSATLRTFRGWLPLIERAKWIRNELAHYRPIQFVDFELFWEGLKAT